MQSKIKICKTNFSQTKKMWNFAYFKNNSNSVLQVFFNILALNAIHPYRSPMEISSWCTILDKRQAVTTLRGNWTERAM